MKILQFFERKPTAIKTTTVAQSPDTVQTPTTVHSPNELASPNTPNRKRGSRPSSMFASSSPVLPVIPENEALGERVTNTP